MKKLAGLGLESFSAKRISARALISVIDQARFFAPDGRSHGNIVAMAIAPEVRSYAGKISRLLSIQVSMCSSAAA